MTSGGASSSASNLCLRRSLSVKNFHPLQRCPIDHFKLQQLCDSAVSSYKAREVLVSTQVKRSSGGFDTQFVGSPLFCCGQLSRSRRGGQGFYARKQPQQQLQQLLFLVLRIRISLRSQPAPRGGESRRRPLNVNMNQYYNIHYFIFYALSKNQQSLWDGMLPPTPIIRPISKLVMRRCRNYVKNMRFGPSTGPLSEVSDCQQRTTFSLKTILQLCADCAPEGPDLYSFQIPDSLLCIYISFQYIQNFLFCIC
jgi:hypothetical protein